MFGLFKQKNPTMHLDIVQFDGFNLNVDLRSVNGVAIRADVNEFSAFGQATGYDKFGKNSFVLTYRHNGMVATFSAGRFISVEFIFRSEPEDNLEACPQINVVRNGREVRIVRDTTADELLEKLGEPHDGFEYELDDTYDLHWETTDYLLSAEFSREQGLQFVEMECG